MSQERPTADASDPGPSPEQLAHDAAAGSETSFAQLVGRFQNPLYQFLRLRVPCAADAEELVHETFVRAWRHLDRYDDRWRFSTWLYTIARREAASFYRRKNAASTQTDGRQIALDPRPEPIVALCAEERRGALWELARSLLNDEQFDSLWLRYVEDLTPREIGEASQRAPSAVRVQLFRSRKILARHLHLQDQPEAILAPELKRDRTRPRRAGGV